MKSILSVAASAALAITGLAVAPQVASADINCTSALSGSHDDTIYVPSGRSCTLNSINLDGDVKLSPGASVTINGGFIGGNVQAEEQSPANVIVKGTRVDGDIQVKYATGTVSVANATVDGNIQIVESRSAIALADNKVGGDIQVFKNPAGTKTINRNTIDGNLQCKENNPAPTGSGNVVRGSAEDQCAGLTGTGGGGGGGGSQPTPPPSNVDVYITPGTHNVNGRIWRTTCEPYSTTERCRTEIQATTVSHNRGRFVQTNGWVFNNLTYKASPRSNWKGNPLAANGVVGGKHTWTDAGRTWRTECDSSTTGRNGCRTWATASVIEYRGGKYQWVTKEILNNMVRFS